MSRKKVRLHKPKHCGNPTHRRKHEARSLARRLKNASHRYNVNAAQLQNCQVVLYRMLLPSCRSFQECNIDGKRCALLRPRVLSLFDGISSGLVALNKLGVLPEQYFASETNEDCIRLQRFNHGDKVRQIGCVRDLSYDVLNQLGDIDLVIGGSPCQDVSGANANRKGLMNEDGKSWLFFEFARVLLFLRQKAVFADREHQFYWMYENVASMDCKTKNTISSYLQCEPLELCSSLFVPMKRKRLFWTNIPVCKLAVGALKSQAMSSREHCLQEFLCGSDRTPAIDVMPTFTSNSSNLVKRGKMPIVDLQKGPSLPYLSEIEKLFGFPLLYTAGPDLTLGVRKLMLANAWDLHTICFIFKFCIKKIVVASGSE